MATSRAQAVRDLALYLDRLLEGTVAATPAPSVRSITDPALSDKARYLDLNDSYLRMASGTQGGQVRRTGPLQLDAGTIPLVRDLASAPAAGDTYELYLGTHPDDLILAINEALKRLYYLEEATITPDGSQDYVVKGASPVITGITDAAELVEVWWERGVAPSKHRDYMWWKPLVAGSTIKLRVYPAATTGTIVVDVLRFYAALATDAATTECPAKLLLAAAAVKYWEWLRHPSRRYMKGADELTIIEAEYQKALRELASEAGKVLPVVMRRRQLPTPFLMPL